ncbi:gephyrin-like molybdotransferase Glp [Anaeromyxobacter sp. SG66]|uniref:molybdopterin molybdotransferase MoeA n=1 Tax=Anaeromyxobacter sp. SG66 TaxID=2925410 RepID=UPI001F59ED71|nr:gephyrin-like molybdotransferase Glp [Anaeromyxobacter sp. SG66]
MQRLLRIRDEVLAAISPLEAEEVALGDAAGRYLAAPARARVPAPPATCSAMDGYAVRAEDVTGPCVLAVTGSRYAGEEAGAPLTPGTAVRIFTGAPLPPGADTVVREEATHAEGGRVRFAAAARHGENVRLAGEDVAAGGLALEPGTRLGARQAALLAAVGADPVSVHRRARVAVISTGDEVVTGRTPDSNGVAVAGLVRALGLEVVRRAVEDRLEAVSAAVAEAARTCDAVVTIGGVSVGERDHVPAALAGLGADVRVHGVPMKPGKPFLFALAGTTPVFGLPGSPSACLVAFEVFARPALLARAGAARRERPALPVRLAEVTEGRPGRARLVWARLEGGGRARPLGKDAAQVRGPALADALLLVPADAGDLPEGAEVTAWLLGDDA